MNKQAFVHDRSADWHRFDALLARAALTGRSRLSAEDIGELSELFRALSYDLSLVRSQDWGSSLERYLNDLVVRGHGTFYGSRPLKRGVIVEFFARGFPRLLRQNRAFFWTASALFAIPMVVSFQVVRHDPSLAHRVLPANVLYTMEQMYESDFDEPEAAIARDDAAMAGFYVRHNTSIAFKCFALGFFLGIGTVYVLLSNAIQLGTVAGYVIAQGHGERFVGFVASHSAFELTAIVVAGAAGLILGHAILAPGNLSRANALRTRGVDALQLALGAAAMLFIAAMIEGFWSAQPLPLGVKLAAAALFWVALVAYFVSAGRVERH